MKKVLAISISGKLVFISLAVMLFFSSCQGASVKSQDESNKSQKPPAKKMNKDKKLESLEDLKWENRIILVREDSDKALRQLRDSAEAINERHIVWFRLSDSKIETNYKGALAENFSKNLKSKYFEKFEKDVFLIGKDGTIKSKDDKLNLKNYFGQIDSMPMRQQEMREN